jgi:hypothetical protein
MRNSFERESEGTLVTGGLPIAKDTGSTSFHAEVFSETWRTRTTVPTPMLIS